MRGRLAQENPESMVNIKLLDRAGFLGLAKNNHIIVRTRRTGVCRSMSLCVSILSPVKSEQLYSGIHPPLIILTDSMTIHIIV